MIVRIKKKWEIKFDLFFLGVMYGFEWGWRRKLKLLYLYSKIIINVFWIIR